MILTVDIETYKLPDLSKQAHLKD